MEYNKKLYDALEKISNKYDELNKELNSPNLELDKMTKINKQIKQSTKIVEMFNTYKKIIKECIDAEEIVANENDPDMIALAKEIIANSKNNIPSLEQELRILLLPTDPNNKKNVIVEIRPAAGGDESSIFVSNLYEMYRRYAEKNNWKIEVMELSTQAHGFDYISFQINGEDVYSKMKFESGVHRVQRVPATETKGRVHTSTVTVAVLPELDELEIKINKADIREDRYRSGGAGGQHVNRTESAVRLTHIPTGIVAACQEGKDQHANRETAMRMLRAKIWEAEEKKRHEEIASTRRSQVGTGERSEKIRTYNYPQNRVTDHRIGLTLTKLEYIMQGDLDEIFDALIADEQSRLMTEFDL